MILQNIKLKVKANCALADKKKHSDWTVTTEEVFSKEMVQNEQRHDHQTSYCWSLVQQDGRRSQERM